MDFPVTKVSSNLYSKTKLKPTRTETETVFLGKTNGMKSDPPFLVWIRISIEPTQSFHGFEMDSVSTELVESGGASEIRRFGVGGGFFWGGRNREFW